MSVSETEIERTKVRERCKERDIERVIMNKRGRERGKVCVCVLDKEGEGKIYCGLRLVRFITPPRDQ